MAFPPQQPPVPPGAPPPPEMMPPPMEGIPPVSGMNELDQDMKDISGEGEEQELVPDTEDARILLKVVQDYEEMESGVRDKNVRLWRKYINYWNSIQYGAWDETIGDWKTPEQILEEDPQADIDPAVYAKVVNVYKAHGEILVGALTQGAPTVRFFPKDADDHDDIAAARSRSKIAELIQRQNKSRLLFMKAIFLLYNCGFLACYNENKTSYKFGSFKTPKIEQLPIYNHTLTCPMCGYEAGTSQSPRVGQEPADESQLQSQIACEQCGYQGQGLVDSEPGSIPMQTGEEENPKNRECLEIHGPLTAKTPLWIRDQVSAPYVCIDDEQPIAMMREIYPELADRIKGFGYGYTSSYGSSTDEIARVPYQYGADVPRDLCNVQRWWFRPWALNIWDRDQAQLQALKQKYPEGVYCVVINKSFIAEIIEDKLDDHWTFADQPLSETMHAQPLGAPMVPLQDIENELDNLTLETIEFGIPELFADPSVLDFDAYQRQELRPGQVSQATPRSGRTLGEAFFELKAASLSREVDLFADRMNSRQQFVQGTYPSIYGGSQEGGSGTAREYELSKASALQRLNSTWVIIQEWWAQVMQRSVQSFVKNMKTDESFVRSKGSNFVNVWIRKSELSGEVGEVEAEVTEPFPVSWAQKRDVIMNLIQMNNEDIMTVIRHPENAGMIATIIGVPELYIPGDDDRNKQLMEIAKLIVAEPILGAPSGPEGQPQQQAPQQQGQPPLESIQGPPGPPTQPPPGPMGSPAGAQMEGQPPQGQPPTQPPGPPMGPGGPPSPMGGMQQMGQGGMDPRMLAMLSQMGGQSSIPVDPDLDNHAVEVEICKGWLKSEVGQDAKETNPAGYLNVLFHMKEHAFFVAQAAAQEAESAAEEEEAPAPEA